MPATAGRCSCVSDIRDEQWLDLCAEVEGIRKDVYLLTHGNGRQGVRALLEDVYGPDTRHRAGLFERVVVLEAEVEEVKRQRNESKWMQRGIAVAAGLLLIEAIVGVELARIVRSLVGS